MTTAGDGHESPYDRHSEEPAPGAGSPAAGASSSGPADTEPAETEPDARFTMANERTFLAWSRTALALVAAGLGIVQLLPPFPGVPLGRHVVGIPLIILGAVIAVAAYADMTRNQRALRREQPLPRSVLPRLLAATIGGVATVAAVVTLISATR
jgi:inner membrane protein YidH